MRCMLAARTALRSSSVTNLSATERGSSSSSSADEAEQTDDSDVEREPRAGGVGGQDSELESALADICRLPVEVKLIAYIWGTK